MIELGKRVKDMISGFEGIATGRAEYLYGCVQYCIVPRIDGDGKSREGEWFDEGRLIVCGDGLTVEDVSIPNKPGGPQRDAPPAR